jgi:hypothetical protein
VAQAQQQAGFPSLPVGIPRTNHPVGTLPTDRDSFGGKPGNNPGFRCEVFQTIPGYSFLTATPSAELKAEGVRMAARFIPNHSK